MLEEGVDHFEDGALLGGGELLNLLEALQEARGAGPEGLRDRREAQELIGRDAERGGQGGELRAGRLGIGTLVVGDHPIGHPDAGPQLLLGEAARLAELREARPEATGSCSGPASRSASHERRKRIERRRTQGEIHRERLQANVRAIVRRATALASDLQIL